MIAGTPTFDLDDAASLEAADTAGALRSAASGGAQVRATAAAVVESSLTERLSPLRPRSLVLVAGSGRAARAAGLLVATLGDRAGLPIVTVTALPPWVGPLDVVLVAGDDAGDPRLIDAVDRALRRSAEVVIAAPNEGPLRAVAAGRAIVLEPRVPVLDHNRLLRFLAAGIAVVRGVDAQRSGAITPDLTALADVLDAEALRGGPHNEVFHNPAKTLAARMQGVGVVLAGDSPAAVELAGHGAEVLLQSAGKLVSAADLADTVASVGRLAASAGSAAPGFDPLFHDEELDGPAPVDRVRVLALSVHPDRATARRKLAVFEGAGAGLVDADLVHADVDLLQTQLAEPGTAPAAESAAADSAAGGGHGSELVQLAVLALRLDMAAAYLRLTGARGAAASHPAPYDDGGRY
ncbi:tobH protein [Nocardia halotolerans]|uniref:TobH protein n=1 Tax=Nocardia halotolerans TaxID=1755878 RepID=A0ABV8VIR2_9NOCA